MLWRAYGERSIYLAHVYVSTLALCDISLCLCVCWEAWEAANDQGAQSEGDGSIQNYCPTASPVGMNQGLFFPLEYFPPSALGQIWLIIRHKILFASFSSHTLILLCSLLRGFSSQWTDRPKPLWIFSFKVLLS